MPMLPNTLAELLRRDMVVTKRVELRSRELFQPFEHAELRA